MKYTKTQRTAIVIATAILFMAVLAGYYYLNSGRVGLVDKTISLRNLAKSAESTRAQGKEILAIYENTKEARSGLTNFFIPSDSAVTIIQAIETVGTHSGANVSISSIKSHPPEKKDMKIGKIVVSVVVNGSWKEVMKAFQLFETLPYNIRIEKVNMSSSGITGENNEVIKKWQMGFDLSVLTISESISNATTTKK